MNTENKNTKTLEELKLEVESARNAYEFAKKAYAQMEQEEEDRRKAELAAKRETRYKEVINAYENFEELMNNFVKDYGKFSFKSNSHNNLSDFLVNFFA